MTRAEGVKSLSWLSVSSCMRRQGQDVVSALAAAVCFIIGVEAAGNVQLVRIDGMRKGIETGHGLVTQRGLKHDCDQGDGFTPVTCFGFFRNMFGVGS